MRQWMSGLACLALGSTVAWAQDGYYQPRCRPAQPNCAPRYIPYSPAPETAPGEPEGAFMRTPETGEVAGESEAIGIRGPAFRLPAISIELPEIRLPSFVRYRKNAEMYVESSRAPWINRAPLEFSQVDQSPEAGRPQGEPETTPGQPDPETDRQRDCVPGCNPRQAAPFPDDYYRQAAPVPPDTEARYQQPDPAVLEELRAAREELARYREELDSLKSSLRGAVDEHERDVRQRQLTRQLEEEEIQPSGYFEDEAEADVPQQRREQGRQSGRMQPSRTGRPRPAVESQAVEDPYVQRSAPAGRTMTARPSRTTATVNTARQPAAARTNAAGYATVRLNSVPDRAAAAESSAAGASMGTSVVARRR